MADGHEMVDGPLGAGHVVDVDAGHVEAGQRALEHDREAVAHERLQLRVVGARTADDQPIGVLRPEQAGVARIGAIGSERLDHHPEATPARRGCQAAQRLGQDGVGGDLLRGLAQDEGQDVGSTPGQLSGGGVRVVTQAFRGSQHAGPRLGRDLHVRPAVEDERDRRPRHPGLGRNVRAGRPSAHLVPLLHP